MRIERLWVDLTTTLGAKWAEFFQLLEVQYGLDPNNSNHLWLLHYLYLPESNAELDFFVETWNHHRIQIRGQPNRSPIDLFGFDMLVHGIRGDELLEEELELYGVDWEALGEDVPTTHISRTILGLRVAHGLGGLDHLSSLVMLL